MKTVVFFLFLFLLVFACCLVSPFPLVTGIILHSVSVVLFAVSALMLAAATKKLEKIRVITVNKRLLRDAREVIWFSLVAIVAESTIAVLFPMLRCTAPAFLIVSLFDAAASLSLLLDSVAVERLSGLRG